MFVEKIHPRGRLIARMAGGALLVMPPFMPKLALAGTSSHIVGLGAVASLLLSGEVVRTFQEVQVQFGVPAP